MMLSNITKNIFISYEQHGIAIKDNKELNVEEMASDLIKKRDEILQLEAAQDALNKEINTLYKKYSAEGYSAIKQALMLMQKIMVKKENLAVKLAVKMNRLKRPSNMSERDEKQYIEMIKRTTQENFSLQKRINLLEERYAIAELDRDEAKDELLEASSMIQELQTQLHKYENA